MKKLYFC